MGFALSQVNVRLGFRLKLKAKRLVRETQSGAIRCATRRMARIHGGIKARENNVEEAVASSGCSSACGKSRIQRESPPRWHGHEYEGRRRVLRNSHRRRQALVFDGARGHTALHHR